MHGHREVRRRCKAVKTGDTGGGNADIAAAKTINPAVADLYAAYGFK